MNLKLIVATLVIAAVPVFAQVQESRAANVKADAQEVVKLISADKAKTQAYCDIAKLGEQMDQAEQAGGIQLDKKCVFVIECSSR
jgi:hypothetical protein